MEVRVRAPARPSVRHVAERRQRIELHVLLDEPGDLLRAQVLGADRTRSASHDLHPLGYRYADALAQRLRPRARPSANALDDLLERSERHVLAQVRCCGRHRGVSACSSMRAAPRRWVEQIVGADALAAEQAPQRRQGSGGLVDGIRRTAPAWPPRPGNARELRASAGAAAIRLGRPPCGPWRTSSRPCRRTPRAARLARPTGGRCGVICVAYAAAARPRPATDRPPPDAGSPTPVRATLRSAIWLAAASPTPTAPARPTGFWSTRASSGAAPAAPAAPPAHRPRPRLSPPPPSRRAAGRSAG
jgi:hypothetical protein